MFFIVFSLLCRNEIDIYIDYEIYDSICNLLMESWNWWLNKK